MLLPVGNHSAAASAAAATAAAAAAAAAAEAAAAVVVVGQIEKRAVACGVFVEGALRGVGGGVVAWSMSSSIIF